MKLTHRLIIILGDFSLINNETIVKTIAGFHACTVIKTLNSQILENVYHYNKNAVYFSKTYQISWQNMYNPIIIRLTEEETDVSKSILGINNIIEDFPKILDSKNVDVGDHSSQDSSNMVTQSPNECLLCRIRDHNTENVEHILYETKNFYVVPGTGAFFEGYLMIVPKDHVMSFALLEESKLREFYRVLDDIRFIQESIYGKKVFAFECASGRTGAGKHKTSIVHAHFHLAPTDMPVLQEVNKSGIHPQPIQKEALCEYGEHPYMLYVDQEDNWSIACDPNCYYPRQQPRQVLANWMDCYKIYNWRFYPFREKMDIIATQFREFCRNNYNNLPEWVKTSVVFDD